MADKKISELPAATTPTGAEELAAVQSGGNVKMTVNQVKDLAVAASASYASQAQASAVQASTYVNLVLMGF